MFLSKSTVAIYAIDLIS